MVGQRVALGREAQEYTQTQTAVKRRPGASADRVPSRTALDSAKDRQGNGFECWK